MKKLLFILLLQCLTTHAFGWAIGIQGGEYTALSAQLSKNDVLALNSSVSWGSQANPFVNIKLDYVIYHQALFPSATWPFYYGIGITGTTGANPNLGLRLPIGLEYSIGKTSTRPQLFAAVVSQCNLSPRVGIELQGEFGVRIEFAHTEPSEDELQFYP